MGFFLLASHCFKIDYECMIGDEADPNVPWTVSYRYNGYKGVSSK